MRVLVISFSDISRDSRVDRQIGFLNDDCQVVVAGLGRPQHDVEYIDLIPAPVGRARYMARRAAGLARLTARRSQQVYWHNAANRVALERLSALQVDVVVANDLPALPLACVLPGAPKVVFDAHEYAPAELSHKRWWRLLIAPYLEDLLDRYLPVTDGMITVGGGISKLYKDRFGISSQVVTNAPAMIDLSPGAVGPIVKLVHHGVASPERKLEAMIDSMMLLDERFTLDLALMEGSRSYMNDLRQRAQDCSRVRFVPPVDMREIVPWLNGYDIGFYPLPLGLANQVHALPNKLFEFIQARLAVVVGPTPAMGELVEEWGCGIAVPSCDPPALADALRSLTPEHIAAFKERSHVAAATLNATRNREIVLDLVERVVSGDRPAWPSRSLA